VKEYLHESIDGLSSVSTSDRDVLAAVSSSSVSVRRERDERGRVRVDVSAVTTARVEGDASVDAHTKAEARAERWIGFVRQRTALDFQRELDEANWCSEA
jgi:hypothetical protein